MIWFALGVVVGTFIPMPYQQKIRQTLMDIKNTIFGVGD